VGDFGDGRINAYRSRHGRFTPAGQLGSVKIDGLWALQFGMGAANNGPKDSLFFTAGPGDESHGLFGTIRSAM
jgi:hypothetical protein